MNQNKKSSWRRNVQQQKFFYLWQQNYFLPSKLAILPCMQEVTVSIPGPQTRRDVATLNIMPDDVKMLRASIHEL